MKDYSEIISTLAEWDPSERFFRDWTYAKEHNLPDDELFQREDVPLSDRKFVLDPDGYNEDPVPETRFFTETQNVVLLKHPRYCPFFTHRHAFFEMVYVLFGKCTQTAEGHQTVLSEGDLCLLAPGTVHGIRVFDDSLIINILVKYSTFMDIFLNSIRDKSQLSLFFLENLYEKNSIPYLLYHTGEDAVIRNEILDMIEETGITDEYSDRILCSRMTIFFSQLTRRHGQAVEIADMHSARSPYRDEMLSYIMNNCRDLTLSDLAEHFHFSVPYCSKLVRSISGKSFTDLITGFRMQQAENLLSHTQLTIAQISETTGYQNPETFIRAFQRTFRCSPSQYRRG